MSQNGDPQPVLRFGDVALRQKFVTKEQLDAAIDRQREIKLPIGEVLVEMGFVTPSQVAAILKFQRVLHGFNEKAAHAPDDPASSPDALVGETLGGCLILETIGAGAMGRAYKAHHLKLDRDVCVKLLHPELCKDRRTLARFTREARSAAKLEHQGIVSVYDFDEVGPYTYMVMQYVDGKSLKDVLDERGPVGPKRAAFIGSRIAEALACAHAQKIVHRDVKPANVLVSKQGHLKLADFGLVRVIEQHKDEGAASSFGELIGSPVYMSPEQARAEAEIDGRSDVYSLGVLIYELACGKPPFESKHLVTLLKQHLLDPFPSLRARCGDCPPELDELIQRMTRKEPAQRPDAAQTARELRAIYRSSFGSEPPGDMTGPATRNFGPPQVVPPGFTEHPTGFYSQRDVMEVTIDKLVARALAGNVEQAAKDAKRLPHPFARDAVLRMLTDLVAANRSAEVVASLETLFEMVKESATGLATLARALIATGDAPIAAKLLAEASAKAPDDVSLALELAQLKGSLGDRAGATAALETLVARKPADAQVWKRAAEIRYMLLGDPAGAASYYGRAADLDRSSFETRQQQGFLLLEAGQPELACKALEDAIARQPGSSLAHELLGKARRLKGDRLGARAALERAVDLDPRAKTARILLDEARDGSASP